MALQENNNHACNNISTLCGTKNHLPNKSYSPSCYIKLFKVQNYIVYLMQEGKNWNDHGITWMLDEALNSMNIKVSIHKSENYDTICQRYQIWMFWTLELSCCIWNFPHNHGLFICNAEDIFSNVLFVPWDIFANLGSILLSFALFHKFNYQPQRWTRQSFSINKNFQKNIAGNF